MPYRIDNKFVSKAAYDAHVAAQQTGVKTVSETTDTPETKPARKPREASAETVALARLRKAKKDLERVTRLHEKREELPSLDAAQQEYDDAKASLNELL